jgi:hypothetical protein
VSVCDLILGPPSSRDRLADRVEEVIGQLWVEQATRREADTKLEAPRSSATQVQNLMLERSDRTSPLAASLSSMVELIEDRIDTVAANRVR